MEGIYLGADTEQEFHMLHKENLRDNQLFFFQFHKGDWKPLVT